MTRSQRDTFAGIYPSHVAAFIFAQIAAATAALVMLGWLLSDQEVY